MAGGREGTVPYVRELQQCGWIGSAPSPLLLELPWVHAVLCCAGLGGKVRSASLSTCAMGVPSPDGTNPGTSQACICVSSQAASLTTF